MGATPSARATHALYPPRGTPRLLVPLRPRRATAASVQHYTTPSSARDRGMLRFGAALAWLGAANLAPRIALGGLETLADHLSGVLGEELAVGVHLGPPRANRKPVLQLMDCHGRPVAYAKLGINDLTCDRVRAEAAALHQITRAAPSGLVAPEIVTDGVWKGLDYLVMRPVPTWSVTMPSRDQRTRALKGLTAAFASTRRRVAEACWWQRTEAALNACDDGPDVARLRAAAARLLERYGHEVIEAGAGHGDWTPWNMCSRQGILTVWDWERFSVDVPRGWDELHFTIASHPGGAAVALEDPRAVLRSAFSGHQRSEKALLATYLLNRAVNFVADRQLQAGAPNGPLRTWLLPALDQIVAGSRAT